LDYIIYNYLFYMVFLLESLVCLLSVPHLLPVDPMAEAKLQWGDAPHPGTGKPCRVLGVKADVRVEK